MAKSQDQTASFMMLCISDYANKLWIPTKFMRKYSEIAEKIFVVLQTDSENFWDVKIQRMDGDFYMTDGWPEFVKDNELTDFNFLTFRLLHGSANFKVSVYGDNGCPKRPASSSSDDDDGDDDDDEIKARSNENVRKRRVFGSKSGAGGRSPKFVLHEDEDVVEMLHKNKARDEKVRKMRVFGSKIRPRGRPPKIVLQGTKVSMNRRQSNVRNDVVSIGSSNGNPLYFEKCLRYINRSRITLPGRVWKAGGLMERKYLKMEFAASGNCKRIALDHLMNRIDLATGWSEFRKANRISFGNTYSFEYNLEQNVILVKEVKK